MEGFFLPNNKDFWKTRKNKAGLSLPFGLSDMCLADAFEPVTVASCILLRPRLADSHGFVVGSASFLPFPKHWDEARVLGCWSTCLDKIHGQLVNSTALSN